MSEIVVVGVYLVPYAESRGLDGPNLCGYLEKKTATMVK
jgi:hypothetical protein